VLPDLVFISVLSVPLALENTTRSLRSHVVLRLLLLLPPPLPLSLFLPRYLFLHFSSFSAAAAILENAAVAVIPRTRRTSTSILDNQQQTSRQHRRRHCP